MIISTLCLAIVIVAADCCELKGLGKSCEENAGTAIPNERKRLSGSRRSQELLDNLLEQYDKQERPHHGGPPERINVSLFIKDILYISETTMEFQVDIYFRQNWMDPRLVLPNQGDDPMPLDYMRVDPTLTSIWQPDTFFRNELTASVHSATVRNEFLKILTDGSVRKSTRYTLSTSCPMDLRNFPMDTQTCTIWIESYGYNDEELQFKWDAQHMRLIFHDQTLPNFQIVGYRIAETTLAYPASHSYSNLKLDIILSRRMGFYIIQIYIPCASLVVVSWFAFWIDSSSTSDRISLGVTTILTVTMMSTSVTSASPKIPYVKAVDIYVGICFAFIFAALMENVTVGYLRHKRRDRVASLTNNFLRANKQGSSGNKNQDNVLKEMQSRVVHDTKRHSCPDMDVFAKIFFPLAFGIINLVYWIHYLQGSKVDENDGFIGSETMTSGQKGMF